MSAPAANKAAPAPAVISQAPLSKQSRATNPGTVTPPCGLTVRQVAVIAERARGFDNDRIAAGMGLTIGQVKHALRTAAVALGVVNCGAAIVDGAFRLGVLQAKASSHPRVVLSLAQRELLRGMAEGLTDRQIARRFARTENTVKTNVKALLGALGARNREHAVALAHRDGYLTAPVGVDGLRLRFKSRVRIGRGQMVHAWDGGRPACWSVRVLSPAEATRDAVSCAHCLARLQQPAVTR